VAGVESRADANHPAAGKRDFDAPSSSYSYTYDLLGRETGEDQSFGPVTVDLAYTYDAAGNRTSVGDGTAAVASTYTDANRLDTLGMTVSSTLGPNVAFSYDSAGQLSGLTRQEGTSGATIDSTFAYDPAGRLRDIAQASSAAGALAGPSGPPTAACARPKVCRAKPRADRRRRA
jgi:YD repeat-containing protein